MPAINSIRNPKYLPSWRTFSKIRKTWSFHVVVWRRTATKCTKIYNARAQLLLCSLNLFSDVVLLSWFSYPYSLCSCEDLPKTKVVPKTVKTPNTVIQCTVMYNREHFHAYESGNWNATSAKLSKHEELWSASVTFSKSLAVWCGIRKRHKFPGNNTAVNEVHPGKKKIMYFIQYR